MPRIPCGAGRQGAAAASGRRVADEGGHHGDGEHHDRDRRVRQLRMSPHGPAQAADQVHVPTIGGAQDQAIGRPRQPPLLCPR
jgi:hypothetical protein